MTVNETHKRWFELILRHGNAEERDRVLDTMAAMRDFRLAFPGSKWEPIEQVTLPSFLISRCDRVAKARHKRAVEKALKNKHGVRRTLEEELRTVEAQHAACVMLGLEFNAMLTDQEAKAHGNLGNETSVHCPRPGSYRLIVGEKEPPKRKMVSMIVDGDHAYKCQGWLRAGIAQQEQFRQHWVRDGVASHPFMVPTELLSPLKEWFAV